MDSVWGALVGFTAAGGADDAGGIGGTLPAVLGSVAVALVGLFTAYLGVRASRQQNRLEAKNDEAQRRLDERKQLDGYYDQLNKDMRERLDQLTTDNKSMYTRIEELQGQIDHMKVERAQDRLVIDVLVTYCRQLIVILRDSGVEPPMTPAELSAYRLDHPGRN